MSGEFIVNEPLKYFTVGNKKIENLPDDRLFITSQRRVIPYVRYFSKEHYYIVKILII